MASDYVTLLGVEDVQRAGRAMQEAAQQFRQEVGYFGEWVQRMERALNEHADRIERAILRNIAEGGPHA